MRNPLLWRFAVSAPALAQKHPQQHAFAGAGTLAGGRAMTLRTREPGVLRVVQGRLWATCDGPHPGALNDQGDHVLDAGDEMRVSAGQRLVIEAWNGATPALFDWEPLPSPC
jgi:hypothetical protein